MYAVEDHVQAKLLLNFLCGVGLSLRNKSLSEQETALKIWL